MKQILFFTFLFINLLIFAQSNFTIGTGIRFHDYSDVVNPVYHQTSPDNPPYLVSFDKINKHENKFALALGYTYSFRLKERIFFRTGSYIYYSKLKYDHIVSKIDNGLVLNDTYLSYEIVDRQDYDLGIPLHFGFKLKKMDFSLGSTIGLLLYSKYYSEYLNGWKGGYENSWLPKIATQDRVRIWLDFSYNYILNKNFKIGLDLKWNLMQHDPMSFLLFTYTLNHKN